VHPFFEHVRSNYMVLGLLLLASAMLLHFLIQYLLLGLVLRGELVRIAGAISSLKSRPPGQIKATLARLFAGTRLQFAWREYEETLHEQSEVRDGERQVREIRATVPAELFINAEHVIDPRIGSEYFKHLPGILTGFGIIGTFGGLIQGLAEFDPSASDTGVLRRSITGLFGHVQDAFTFSALAITCAILVTALEKWLYASCVKWVGQVGHALDALFRAGVGEEYLSGLLRSSEDSALSVRELKQSMGDDLTSLLTHLSDRQVAATQQLSTDLASQIEASLKEPLAEIAVTVRAASGAQQAAASRVLERLMKAFLEQMREALGEQFSEFTQQMGRAAAAIAGVEISMRALIEDLRSASEDANAGTQRVLRELMRELAEHRRVQEEASLAATRNLISQVEEAIGRIALAQEELTRRARGANEAVSAELESRVQKIASVNASTLAATRETLEKLSSSSGEMIEKLLQGTSAVASSIAALQSATERMSHSTAAVTGLESKMAQSAHSLGQASLQLIAVSERVSTTVIQLVATTKHLEAVAALASTETEARGALLKDLRRVMADAQTASSEFGALAQHVRALLREGIDEFGGQVSRTLPDSRVRAERG
jgi:hypothetical protein